MLWSIDSCQNRLSADQYHLNVPRAQVSTHRGRVFFEVIHWQISSFTGSQAQVFYQWFIWNMLCLCHYGQALWGFWFQTDLERENSASFLKIQAGKTFYFISTEIYPHRWQWWKNRSVFSRSQSATRTMKFHKGKMIVRGVWLDERCFSPVKSDRTARHVILGAKTG